MSLLGGSRSVPIPGVTRGGLGADGAPATQRNSGRDATGRFPAPASGPRAGGCWSCPGSRPQFPHLQPWFVAGEGARRLGEDGPVAASWRRRRRDVPGGPQCVTLRRSRHRVGTGLGGPRVCRGGRGQGLGLEPARCLQPAAAQPRLINLPSPAQPSPRPPRAPGSDAAGSGPALSGRSRPYPEPGRGPAPRPYCTCCAPPHSTKTPPWPGP